MLASLQRDRFAKRNRACVHHAIVKEVDGLRERLPIQRELKHAIIHRLREPRAEPKHTVLGHWQREFEHIARLRARPP